jgi:hypothetical protein
LAQAYYNRGVAKKDQGDSSGAAGDFNRAVKLEPKLGEKK